MVRPELEDTERNKKIREVNEKCHGETELVHGVKDPEPEEAWAFAQDTPSQAT